MVKAERPAPDGGQELSVVRVRPRGVFSRQLFLGDSLDIAQVQADYGAGVLTLRTRSTNGPNPLKIPIGNHDRGLQAIHA